MKCEMGIVDGQLGVTWRVLLTLRRHLCFRHGKKLCLKTIDYLQVCAG